MKILIVCRGNSGKVSPFVSEQVEDLRNKGIELDYFLIKRKGIIGYLKHIISLHKKINAYQPDFIHAHYGLSGLLANLQQKTPVVTTYHGSDINDHRALRFSKLAIKLSKHNIFVSKKLMERVELKSKSTLIPCGVNIELFCPMEKNDCRKELNLAKDKKLILFSGSFENRVKNASLAMSAMKRLNDVELLELKSYSRQQVAMLMNAVDCCLMTSHTEGSPQFIKEAMACNCPIVSVDVGDVKDVIGNTKGCYICNYDEIEIADKINLTLQQHKRTNGREMILNLGLDHDSISKKIITIYKSNKL